MPYKPKPKNKRSSGRYTAIAYRIGRKAGFDGAPNEACPYRAEEFVLAWRHGRRNAIASLAYRRRRDHGADDPFADLL